MPKDRTITIRIIWDRGVVDMGGIIKELPVIEPRLVLLVIKNNKIATTNKEA